MSWQLIKRAGEGDLDGVKRLIQQGADVNRSNDSGVAALYCACREGHTEVAEYLLESGASVNVTANPVIAAIANDHYQCVKLLLQHNANVNFRSDKGCSLIAIAAQWGNYSIIDLLLEYGATDSSGLCIPTLLKDAKLQNAKTVEKLIEKNIIKSQDILACYSFALEHREDNLAQRTLEIIMNSAGEQYADAVYYSAKNNMPEILSKLIRKEVDINLLRGGKTHGKTVLYAACKEGHQSVVNLLLNSGADPNVRNTRTTSKDFSLPLQIVVQRGNVGIFYMLLGKGANLNQPDEPLLHIACSGDAEQKSSDRDANWNQRQEHLLHWPTACCGGAVKRKFAGKDVGTKSDEQQLSMIRLLLEQGVDVNAISGRGDTALYRAVDAIISALLNAGASVNMVNREGRNTVCFAAELLTSSGIRDSHQTTTKTMSTIHLLLQNGANFKMLMADGYSPLYLVVRNAPRCIRYRDRNTMACIVELMQLMVKEGAMLKDSVCLDASICSQSLRSGMLMTLTTYDFKHKFIVELLRAGAGFQVISTLCDAVATRPREAKSIRLCQSVVLAGYSPSDEELRKLQFAAAGETEEGGLLKQLLNWLNEDKQQVPSLVRQCRIAIRRQLSEAVHHQTIIPAIDQLPLPNDLKLYLQFDGTRTEVDLSVNEDLQTLESTE